MNPQDMIRLSLQMSTLMVNTQTVMALRLMGMAGMVPALKGENNRMVSEKGPAMLKAYNAGAAAAMSGKRPDQIMIAAMDPLSKKVSANRKRLLK
ncbi:hypothetical protein SAMN04488523_101177 [Sulfitobacter brevis]|uniref:Antifreeze protein n=1 Tax=Sulfitobacter brevis TaxID=74348 RepID=A0A1I1SVD4_9RHOB|nr:antifreeze protein [Sulfitobacter brevis]SFD50459.1 hypothetical protein SAMN04488523_101177 [Sulfitobacter brevis]